MKDSPEGLPFNFRENNVTSDDEVDLVLVGNSTEPAKVTTVGNNTIQSTTGNVVLQNVPHNLENIPVGYEFNNFVMNNALAEGSLHGQSYAEENRSNLGQGSDDVLNLSERQSYSSSTNAHNIRQNEDNTSETEIVNSLHVNNVNTATAAVDADDDDDIDDVDYDDELSSSETDDEFDDDNSDFDSDDSDFHDLIIVYFTIIVLW